MTGTSQHPLSDDQIAQFRRDGYLLLEAALSPATLTRLNLVFAEWIEESRRHTESYGSQADGRPRVSLEPEHSAERPALRRIASPQELSDTYHSAIHDGRGVDAAAQLVGPNMRFSNAKINSKQPGAATEVKFHQDFLFEPHTNDDLVTVLYFLDEVTRDNGPLEVVPGSHLGPLYDHWHDGVFTGTVGSDIAARAHKDAVPCTGPAGSACFMHTRLLHGSAPNLSSKPRTLYIVTYHAEDAYPLQANHIPSSNANELVRGVATNRVRCSDYAMAFPQVPSGASFFEQQSLADESQAAAGGGQISAGSTTRASGLPLA